MPLSEVANSTLTLKFLFFILDIYFVRAIIQLKRMPSTLQGLKSFHQEIKNTPSYKQNFFYIRHFVAHLLYMNHGSDVKAWRLIYRFRQG